MRMYRNAFGIGLLGCFVLTACSKHEILSSPSSSAGNVQDNSALILTPYGYLPSSHVHEVSPTTFGTVENGHVLIKDLATKNTVQDLGAVSTADVQATNAYAYAAQLRSLSTLTVANLSPVISGKSQSTTTESISNSPRVLMSTPNVGSSYATNISGTNNTGYGIAASLSNIQSTTTTWTVPALPLDTTGLTYFFWNGLDGGAIQPVLEFQEGRGAKYAIRNWYFTNGQYFHGSAVIVNPGTVIQGVVNFVSNTNDTTWTYTEGFVGYPSADVTIIRKSEAKDPCECFEPYTSLLSQWPNQPYVAMSKIGVTLRSGTLPSTLSWYNWNDGARTTPTGANTVIVNTSSSNGEVDFYMGDGTGITPDSTFQIVSAQNGTSVLDVYQSSTANGTKVELWSANSPVTSNQEWVPISLFNGYYKIASKMDTTKVLEVANASTASGTQIDINSYSGATNQQWKIVPLGNGYCSLSPANASSSALDLYASQTANGTKIELWSSNSPATTNQEWLFKYIAQH